MQRLRRVLISGIAIYLGVVVVLALLERTLMYPAPSPLSGDWTPSYLDYEDIHATTPHGNTIHGWFVRREGASKTILLCHGNGEHVGYLGEELAFLSQTYNANVLAFDYRGYGKSGGKTYELGVLTDSESAYSWLLENDHATPEDIILWGRSLGGAAAVHLASIHGAHLLVLDRTFNSMVDVASTHYPWLPVRLMLRDRYPSARRIANYSGPVFQVHGQEDRVVPFRCGEALHDAAPGTDKRFLTPPGLGHNHPWPDPIYAALDDMLVELESSE